MTNQLDSAYNNDKLKPFSLDEPEFNTSVYQGRFMKFLKTTNPLLAFYSNTKIEKFKDLI
jgi:hypothetical protein